MEQTPKHTQWNRHQGLTMEKTQGSTMEEKTRAHHGWDTKGPLWNRHQGNTGQTPRTHHGTGTKGSPWTWHQGLTMEQTPREHRTDTKNTPWNRHQGLTMDLTPRAHYGTDTKGTQDRHQEHTMEQAPRAHHGPDTKGPLWNRHQGNTGQTPRAHNGTATKGSPWTWHQGLTMDLTPRAHHGPDTKATQWDRHQEQTMEHTPRASYGPDTKGWHRTSKGSLWTISQDPQKKKFLKCLCSNLIPSGAIQFYQHCHHHQASGLTEVSLELLLFLIRIPEKSSSLSHPHSVRKHLQLSYTSTDHIVKNTGLPTSEILFPYFVEKISVFWVTFPYPLICSSPDSKHSSGNFLFTLVGPIHSQWKL